jgi:prepilin-type processing-associated H-X9-DG protein/prepilin-type N-terminal cleavage/methylation domain-containing protein
MRTHFIRRRRSGFTIVEMLVVIAIICTLVAMLLPAVQKARGAAARAACVNNLKQQALACHVYHDANRAFPAGINSNNWGWAAQLLPYMDQTPLFNKIDLTMPILNYSTGTAAGGVAPIAQTIPSYLCPADTAAPATTGFQVGGVTMGPSSYAACCGNDFTDVADGFATSTATPPANGIFFLNSATTIPSITDGSSQTILIGERAWGQVQGCWAGLPGAGNLTTVGPQNFCVVTLAAQGATPNTTANAQCLVMAHAHLINALTDVDCGTDDFSSNHPGGCNIAFADGHVTFFQNIPNDTATGYTQASLNFQILGTMAAGDIPPPGYQY